LAVSTLQRYIGFPLSLDFQAGENEAKTDEELATQCVGRKHILHQHI